MKVRKPRHERFAFYLGTPLCEKIAKWESLFTFTFLATVLFHSGCSLTRTVSTLSTPRSHEKKIPAEYNLTRHRDRKILILVNQPPYLNAQANLRFYLTEEINKNLIKKVKIPPEYLVGYDELSEFRSNQSNFSLLSPAEVGKALDANMVLLVMLEDYQLHELGGTDYYKGFMSAQMVLFDTASGEKLWPEAAESKSIKVGFEVEPRGRKVAVKRLAAACAYCTTRYLYDCPRDKFKIFDDRSNVDWQDWDK